jgi:hypothetical protein
VVLVRICADWKIFDVAPALRSKSVLACGKCSRGEFQLHLALLLAFLIATSFHHSHNTKQSNLNQSDTFGCDNVAHNVNSAAPASFRFVDGVSARSLARSLACFD